MHLYFYLRGMPQYTAMFEAFLQFQFWKWRRINLQTKKEEIILLQGALRKSVLGAYEYVFPEEALKEVLALLGLTEKHIGAEYTMKHKIKLSVLRKIFGAERIPKEYLKGYDPSRTITGVERGLVGDPRIPVSIHPIGIQRDVREKNLVLGYEQEML